MNDILMADFDSDEVMDDGHHLADDAKETPVLIQINSAADSVHVSDTLTASEQEVLNLLTRKEIEYIHTICII
ncbi:hypothetical protein EW146_g3317 [Bondarzewia mesenterica]|uniref:Uncharacterized protein n=1 Tax=Bondarzewia mesenterica TaxID=1095465 RepID=A0A4S4LXX9_9AGAM|nr:hypothetical protein EW146_g3317 [Bondarzewia mesenterica]